MPAAASRCPTLDFTEPSRSGSARSAPPSTAPIALASIGSPSGVAEPWASM